MFAEEFMAVLPEKDMDRWSSTTTGLNIIQSKRWPWLVLVSPKRVSVKTMRNGTESKSWPKTEVMVWSHKPLQMGLEFHSIFGFWRCPARISFFQGVFVPRRYSETPKCLNLSIPKSDPTGVHTAKPTNWRNPLVLGRLDRGRPTVCNLQPYYSCLHPSYWLPMTSLSSYTFTVYAWHSCFETSWIILAT